MTMPSEYQEDAGQREDGKGDLPANLNQSEAGAADQAAYVPPTTPRRWGGRVILWMQKLVDKVFAGRIVQIQGQVIDQDKELSEVTHDVGELTAQVVQMNRMLQSIDDRLDRLEAMNKSSEPE